jgi:aryl-alcohol dehydrogenase-like predicted oxidoreductase
LDTSPNFNDGQSERAIGQQIRRAISCGDVRRKEVVLMTKAGYIQGSMLRDAKARPSAYEDVVRGCHTVRSDPICGYVKAGGRDRACAVQTPVSEHVWHCMAPEFIQHSLDTSLANLGVAHVDVLFLSNPEVFAKVCCAPPVGNSCTVARRSPISGHAGCRGGPDVRPTGERLLLARGLCGARCGARAGCVHVPSLGIMHIRAAIAMRCVTGKIGYYGVASNSLGPTMAAGHAVSLDRLLRVARDAGGACGDASNGHYVEAKSFEHPCVVPRVQVISTTSRRSSTRSTSSSTRHATQIVESL